jgi:septal ring factor EnvC (AmiA/AmiB activator)
MPWILAWALVPRHHLDVTMVSILATVTIALSALWLTWATFRNTLRATEAENRIAQTTLEDRLDELAESMRESARLVEQVESELEARAATARSLQENVEDAKAFLALHPEAEDAIHRMLGAELVTQAKGIRRDAIIIGCASFVFGVLGTVVVTLLVHPLH